MTEALDAPSVHDAMAFSSLECSVAGPSMNDAAAGSDMHDVMASSSMHDAVTADPRMEHKSPDSFLSGLHPEADPVFTAPTATGRDVSEPMNDHQAMQGFAECAMKKTRTYEESAELSACIRPCVRGISPVRSEGLDPLGSTVACADASSLDADGLVGAMHSVAVGPCSAGTSVAVAVDLPSNAVVPAVHGDSVAATEVETSDSESRTSVNVARDANHAMAAQYASIVQATLGLRTDHALLLKSKHGATVTPAKVDFGCKQCGDTDPVEQELQISNEGDKTLLLRAAFALPHRDAFQISDIYGLTSNASNGTAENGVTLMSGERCTLQVMWKPVSEPGHTQLLLIVACEADFFDASTLSMQHNRFVVGCQITATVEAVDREYTRELSAEARPFVPSELKQMWGSPLAMPWDTVTVQYFFLQDRPKLPGYDTMLREDGFLLSRTIDACLCNSFLPQCPAFPRPDYHGPTVLDALKGAYLTYVAFSAAAGDAPADSGRTQIPPAQKKAWSAAILDAHHRHCISAAEAWVQQYMVEVLASPPIYSDYTGVLTPPFPSCSFQRVNSRVVQLDPGDVKRNQRNRELWGEDTRLLTPSSNSPVAVPQLVRRTESHSEETGA